MKNAIALPENATPAEIEAAMDAYVDRPNRPSLDFPTLLCIAVLFAWLMAFLGFLDLRLYSEAVVSSLVGGAIFALMMFWQKQWMQPFNQMAKRLFHHPEPLTFRQTLLGYFGLSKKRRKQSLPLILQTLSEVTAEEISVLTPNQQMRLLSALLLHSMPEIVLAGMNLVKRLERIDALPFLEKIVKKQAGLYQNRVVRAKAKEVAEFLRPLAALQRTEAQLLHPAASTAPPEQLLRVPQEETGAETTLLRPLE